MMIMLIVVTVYNKNVKYWLAVTQLTQTVVCIFVLVLLLLLLKSDSHIPENFCQIKIFPSHVWKNATICLFGVLKWK